MCLSVCYGDTEKVIITQFSQVQAELPVKTKTNGIKLITWGRRTYEKGKLPLGGWISFDSIEQGKWDRYFPKLVKIRAKKFLEHNVEGDNRWFDVIAGHFIQGVLLSQSTEQRVYVVTIVPVLFDNPYPRWPKLLVE